MNASHEWIGGRVVGDDTLEIGAKNIQIALGNRLGRGATGEVYEGLLLVHEALRRRVALKVLDEHVVPDRDQLLQLVAASPRLQHPGIIVYRALLETPIGYVLASDYIHGLSLAEIQRHLKFLGKRLTTGLAAEIAWQLLEALDYLGGLHQSGLKALSVHQNIRPSNILVDARGRVSLIDLGLESTLKSPGDRSRGFSVVNILPYLAPEQLVEPPRVSAQTDIYALATIFYELLAGRPLFDGSPARRELEIRAGFGVREKLGRLPHSPGGLDKVLEKALVTAPDQRYPEPSEMLLALNPFRNDSSRADLGSLVTELQRQPGWTSSERRHSSRSHRRTAPPNAAGHAKPPNPPRHTPALRHASPHPSSPGDARARFVVGLMAILVAALALVWLGTTEDFLASNQALFDVPRPALEHAPQARVGSASIGPASLSAQPIVADVTH